MNFNIKQNFLVLFFLTWLLVDTNCVVTENKFQGCYILMWKNVMFLQPHLQVVQSGQLKR